LKKSIYFQDNPIDSESDYEYNDGNIFTDNMAELWTN